MRPLLTALTLLAAASRPAAADGNRLAYLDGADAHHPSRAFPRLVTPQWVGEKGVEAVVVLAIDDMRDPETWERYLRPALTRLRKIDGRAPVSIMTCSVDPSHPRLQRWLGEGLSLETHTVDHPCPLLGRAGLEAARSTFERCVDQVAGVKGNRPVAFRVPCCDSQNTPSPRFFREVFNRTTGRGHFLSIDSSVFNVFTPDDPALPRHLVLDDRGRQRFSKYLPGGKAFVNTVHDYPYPYVIDRLCFEFPCATPSDWQGQKLHGPAHPGTLADMKAALDATVRKQGVFNLVFHPYGWMTSAQVVELIDHAVKAHGKKVRFLTFREAHDRLVKNLLAGQPLRAADGGDNGVRLLDLDGDGFMDVVVGNEHLRQSRRWDPAVGSWKVSPLPAALVETGKAGRADAGARFGVLDRDGRASLLVRNGKVAGHWHYADRGWVEVKGGLAGLTLGGRPVETARDGTDRGVRLRDLAGTGVCDLVVGNDTQNGVFAWSAARGAWSRRPFALPEGTRVVDARGRDAGLRFIDIDDDGTLDVLSSNEERYSLHLFTDGTAGWSRRALAGKAGAAGGLPAISRRGANNGAWFHDRSLVVQNETTFALPALVRRVAFNDMLGAIDQPARSPRAGLRSLRARPGFVVEQTAAEPLVRDPIAFAWGADGKLWVVEMGDYPLGVDGKGKAGGRVVYLEDSDGDGKLDRRTVFLDGLAFPTGVLPWRNGVLVTCAPDIFFAEDTDGDGKADRRTVLFTGFVEGNQQHRVNGLVWGLDNWVHVANGDSGGRIRSVKTNRVVDIAGRDLRIRPDTGELEAQTGQTQYGRSRDDAGRWFGGNNSVPMWHFVLDDHYLRRNPHHAAGEVRVQVPAVPGAAPVFPRSRTLPRFNDPGAANRFTSACSPIVYRDDLFGPAFARSLFVSEPVHNLVHREVIRPDGVTFRGRRADDERDGEFLASTDSWFRPTMLQTGPDGALWLADMYRQVIEHPEWIPPDVQKRLDLRAGHDRGRLYRVYPVGARPRAVPRLDGLDAAGLAAALDSPSGWQRDTAHMLLLWRADRKAVVPLEKQARAKRPVTRLQALCVLDGLDALTPGVLAVALGDDDPDVRATATRLCEGRLPGSAALRRAFLARAEDPAATVRLQAALSLGGWADPAAARALGRLLRRDAGDRFIQAAGASSLTRANLDGVLAGLLEGGPPPPALLEAILGQASAHKNDRALVTLLERLAAPAGERTAWRIDVLAGFLDTLEQRGSSLVQLNRDGDAAQKGAIAALAGLFAAARRVAADEAAAEGDRARCVRLLGRGLDRHKEDRELITKLLEPRQPEGVQLAAAAALTRRGDGAAPAALLAGWKGHSPRLRAQILAALLQRPAWGAALVEALEKKRLAPLDLDAAGRQRLLGHGDPAVRRRAARALASGPSGRQRVIDAYRGALTARGDSVRGKAVFARSCATCHRLGGEGREVGPDLAALAGKSAEYLLVAVLDPDRAVEARYLAYQAELVDGRVVTGILSASTATSITLTGPDGKSQAVLRRNLEKLESTGRSLMPEGLEKDVTVEQMADLLAYLRSQPHAAKPRASPVKQP